MTNDELDELRSFRPEATGPTDVLARDERNAFMQAITNDTAHQPTKRPLRRRLPRGRRVVLAFAVALVAAGGAAGAAGLIPDDVQRTLGLTAGGDPAFEANPSEATKRGSTTAADGTVVELWTAPTKGGGTCAYLRHLDAAGKPADGAPVTCQITTGEGATKGQVRGSGVAGPSTGASLSIGGSGGSLNTDMQEQAAGGVVAYGEAPKGTARVIFTDDAGQCDHGYAERRRVVRPHAAARNEAYGGEVDRGAFGLRDDAGSRRPPTPGRRWLRDPRRRRVQRIERRRLSTSALRRGLQQSGGPRRGGSTARLSQRRTMG